MCFAFHTCPLKCAALTSVVCLDRTCNHIHLRRIHPTHTKVWTIDIKGSADVIYLHRASLVHLAVDVDVDVVGPNAHLTRVMQLDDTVSAVSIHHELNVPLPMCPTPPVSQLGIPPPLAPAVVSQFRKWYLQRQPLRLTDRGETSRELWAQFERLFPNEEAAAVAPPVILQRRVLDM
jgi:hypothetical protein